MTNMIEEIDKAAYSCFVDMSDKASIYSRISNRRDSLFFVTYVVCGDQRQLTGLRLTVDARVGQQTRMIETSAESSVTSLGPSVNWKSMSDSLLTLLEARPPSVVAFCQITLALFYFIPGQVACMRRLLPILYKQQRMENA